MSGMVEELKGARMGVKIYADDVVLLADRSGASRYVGCGAGLCGDVEDEV